MLWLGSWCSCGVSNNENGEITDSFVYVYGTFHPTELPHPDMMWLYVSGLITAYQALLDSSPWEYCSFLRGDRGDMNCEKEKRLGKGEGGHNNR